MSGFPILDLVVGMIFIYFLLSIISSSAVEMILTSLQARSQILADWLTAIFDKTITKKDGSQVTLGQAIMDHCATTGLTKSGKAPSYIDAKNFTSALLEKITFDPNNPKSIVQNFDEVIKAIQDTTILSTEMQRALLGYAFEAKETYKNLEKKTISEIEFFRAKVEKWYDTNMDRLTGALKKKYSRPFTLIVAIAVGVVLNADSVAISKFLYSNPEARVQLAAKGFETGADERLRQEMEQLKTKAKDDSTQYKTLAQLQDSITKRLETIKTTQAALKQAVPIGWNAEEFVPVHGFWSWVLFIILKLAGLAVTVLAIFMGAPFWFDILNKISNLRGSGPKPASRAEEERKEKN